MAELSTSKLERDRPLFTVEELHHLRLRPEAGGLRFDAVIPGIDGLRRSYQHRGDDVVVDFHHQVLRGLAPFDLDRKCADLGSMVVSSWPAAV